MKIRKEIKADSTFGGNYTYAIEYPVLPENFIEIEEEQAYEIDKDIAKFKYIDGQIVDISESSEYKTKKAEEEKEAKITQFRAEIEELDKKRIRALAEPQLKDEATGETWLEYYTKQIQALRAEISAL